MKSSYLLLSGILFSVSTVAQASTDDNYKANQPIVQDSEANKLDTEGSKSNPTLHLFKKNDEYSCAWMYIENRNYAVNMGATPCGNDQAYKFQVDSGKKGQRFLLGSDKPKDSGNSSYCPKKDWTFVLELIDDVNLSDKVLISSLKNVSVGSQIARGIILKENNYDHGNIDGKLSCVDTWSQ